MRITAVSVIVPVYNCERYIRSCVDSILKNTFNDFELIIVNDGSTDNTLLICEELKKSDSRVSVISQENAGAGLARNLGVEHSKGKYIMFVDADDIIDRSALLNAVQMMETKLYDFVMLGYNKIDLNGKFIGKNTSDFVTNKIMNTSDFWDCYYNSDLTWCVVPWGKLYKREMIENIKYPNKYYEDEFFINHLASRDLTIGLIQTPLYSYRIHAESTMSKAFSSRYFDKACCFLERLSIFLENKFYFLNNAVNDVIHSCNVLMNHKSFFNAEDLESHFSNCKLVLQKALPFITDRKVEKDIVSFAGNQNLYYKKRYSLFYQFLHKHYFKRLCFLIRNRHGFKKRFSNYLSNGYYLISDRTIKKIDKKEKKLFKTFLVNKRNNKSTLDSAYYYETKYKYIFVSEKEAIYLFKSKERFVAFKDNYLRYHNVLPYPLMKLDFVSTKISIGNTIKGEKIIDGSMFDVVVSYLIKLYINNSYKSVGDLYIQHGDLKDSNIIWKSQKDFTLIDLEAVGLYPYFYDLFFYIFITKKDYSDKYLIYYFNIYFDRFNLDESLNRYLLFLMNKFKEEHNKCYYDYYLKYPIVCVCNQKIMLPTCIDLIKKNKKLLERFWNGFCCII